MAEDADSAAGRRGRPVALVTGGGTGIGRAIAVRLGQAGYDLCLASRSADHLRDGERAVRETGADCWTVPVDVREPDAVAGLLREIGERRGRLDVLVNNAAGNFLVPAEAMSPHAWRAVVGIVLDGTFYCCRFAFPLLRSAPDSSIVNLVAAYAWTGGPGTAHSAAAKGGVLALTRTLSVEWARYRIRVNAVAPGPIRTEGADRQLWPTEGSRRRVAASVPLGRFGTPQEVADAVAFLVGPQARYITGAVLTVDGGQWLHGGLPPPSEAEFAEGPPDPSSARRS